MRIETIFTAAIVAWTVLAATPVARAQFEVPPGSLAFEDTGKLEAVQTDVIKFRDSKNEVWLLKINQQTQITVKGEAEAGYLRPGMSLQFTGQIDKKGVLKEPVDKIEIFTPQGKMSHGLFSPTDVAGANKPARNPGAGTFLIKGKLATYRDGDLLVVAGNRKITGSTSDDLEVTLTSDDPTLAQADDEAKVKVWYDDTTRPNPVLNRAGGALAEQITITLAKPLAATGRKARQIERPAKTTVKSGRGTR
jgi:hypothetical protein